MQSEGSVVADAPIAGVVKDAKTRTNEWKRKRMIFTTRGIDPYRIYQGELTTSKRN